MEKEVPLAMVEESTASPGLAIEWPVRAAGTLPARRATQTTYRCFASQLLCSSMYLYFITSQHTQFVHPSDCRMVVTVRSNRTGQ